MKLAIFMVTWLFVLATDAAAQTSGAVRSQQFIVKEPAADGVDSVTIQAPALSASWTATLPPNDGNANNLLSTDGSGVLSWIGTLTGITLSSPTITGTSLLQNQPGAAQPTLSFSEDPDNGTNFVTLQAPASLAGDYTLTFPPDDGTLNQVLLTDGSGGLSWGTSAAVPTAGAVYSDGSALQSEARLDRTRGGTGITSTATFPGTSTTDADFVMKGAVNQTIAGTKTFSTAPIMSSLSTNGPVYTSGGTGTLNTEANLAVARGGTGVGTLATNGIVYGAGTSNVGVTAQGAANTLLHGNGASAPSFSAVVSADITDGTIVNADIATGANIALTKLAPASVGGLNAAVYFNPSGQLTNASALPVGVGGTGIANGSLNQGALCYASDSAGISCASAGTASQWALSGGTGQPTFSDTTSRAKTFTAGVVFNGGGTNLNFYEENTWTPTRTFSTSNGTASVGTTFGRFTRIGNRVMFTGYAAFTKGTASGNFSLTGLTYASSNITNNYTSVTCHAADGFVSPTNYGSPIGYIAPNSTAINFQFSSLTGAPASSLSAAEMDSGTIEIFCQGTYQAG